MDQAFFTQNLRNRPTLPPGSFSNTNRGRIGDVSSQESLSDQPATTLVCRPLEGSADLLQKAALAASAAFPPFLIRKTSFVSPTRALCLGATHLPPRPYSGRVVSSAGPCAKARAGLRNAAINPVIRAGGQDLYAPERRSGLEFQQAPQQRLVGPSPSAGSPINGTPPITTSEYGRFYVFDWDNTLCPTEWLCELYARSGQNLYLSRKPCQALNSPAVKPKIDLLQQEVRKLLLKCREKGEVAIVSNATTIGLIRTLRLLPVIQKTIEELQITMLSSRDMCEPHGLPLEEWKDTAMLHMLLEFAGRHANEKLSVFTFGDQDFEHLALLNASEYLQRQFGRDSCPKCIKYVESPSIEAVIKQTSVCIDLLDQVPDAESGTYMMDQEGAVWKA